MAHGFLGPTICAERDVSFSVIWMIVPESAFFNQHDKCCATQGAVLRYISRPFFVIGITGTVLSLSLASCTTLSPGNPAAGTQSPSGLAAMPSSSPTPASAAKVPLVWADGSRVEPRNIHNVDQAREAIKGQDFTEESSSKNLSNAKILFQSEGIDSTGTLVGLYGPRQSEKEIEKTGIDIDPDKTSIGRVADGKFTPFTVPGSPNKNHTPGPVHGLTISDGLILWAELLPEDAPNPGWKVMSVAAGSNDARVLATHSFKKSQSPQHDMLRLSAPVLQDGRVYWSFSHVNPADDVSLRKTYSLDMAKPGTFREEPLLSDTDRMSFAGTLFAGKDGLLDSTDYYDKNFAVTAQTISTFSAANKLQEILHLEEDPTVDYAMQLKGSDTQGFAVEYDNKLYLVDAITRDVELFLAPQDQEFGELQQCGRKVSWNYRNSSDEDDSAKPGFKQYVFDRETNDLSVAVIAEPVGSGMDFCAGEYNSWSVIDPKEVNYDGWDSVTRWKN